MLGYEKRAEAKGYKLIAGVDEAGCGPLAGPVVASAVILRGRRFNSEISDSKTLSAEKRLAAYNEITKKAVIGIGIVDEEIVDRINIRNAVIKAMEAAVAVLRIKPGMLLIDGNLKLSIKYPQKPIVRGDSKSLSIAAASIMAKVTRDAIMKEYHEIYPRYRFDLHKGYGTQKHIQAIRKYGPSPIHRNTFRIKSINC